MSGRVNVTDRELLDNIAYAIRQGHPQVQPADANAERILLVGGGPSLQETKDELIQLYYEGAKIVTVNGAYHWCLSQNLRPSVQIVVDARGHNSRFVEPAVPNCTYLLASQCASETWKAVEGRERVWIWHALGEGDDPIKEILDAYYLKRWHGIAGGTTVAVRALLLLRTLGFVQFDLFGIDSCWGAREKANPTCKVCGGRGWILANNPPTVDCECRRSRAEHHAYPQPENDNDKRLPVRISPLDDSHEGKEFWVAPWHLVQFENYLNLMSTVAEAFGRITIHGDGMLAYAMQPLGGDVKITKEG
jgi:hypothetical protein